MFYRLNLNTLIFVMHYINVASAVHHHLQRYVEMVSNEMLLITVVFVGVLGVGGGL